MKEENREQQLCSVVANEVEAYESPAIQVIEMEIEGVIAASMDNIPGHGW